MLVAGARLAFKVRTGRQIEILIISELPRAFLGAKTNFPPKYGAKHILAPNFGAKYRLFADIGGKMNGSWREMVLSS